MEEKKLQEEHLEEQVEATEDQPKDELVNEEKDELALLKEENQKLNDKNLRLTAEFQNFKRRTEKEKSDIYKFSNEKLMMEILPVIDNIERALHSIEDAEDHKAVVEGVNMIKMSFDGFLEKNGVKAIDAVGQPFDPELHHAVLSEESEEHDEDIVIEELQKGYTLNEKVIRHSMVKVSK